MIRTAVILAAGISARLNNSLQEKPKGLLKIGNKTLVERSLGHLYANGIERVKNLIYPKLNKLNKKVN